MSDRLDALLAESAPATTTDRMVSRDLASLVRATEEKAVRRPRRIARCAVGGVLAATLGAGGVAAATELGSMPDWAADFGYDSHRSFTGADGEPCHEVLLVSPYVHQDDPTPPSTAEVERAVEVAREVVANYDLSTVDGAITRDELQEISEAVDAELDRRALPKAYALGAGGDCDTKDAS